MQTSQPRPGSTRLSLPAAMPLLAARAPALAQIRPPPTGRTRRIRYINLYASGRRDRHRLARLVPGDEHGDRSAIRGREPRWRRRHGRHHGDRPVGAGWHHHRPRQRGDPAIAPSLYPSLAYDAAKDFTFDLRPVAAAQPAAGQQRLPARSVPELIALLKRNPGKYLYASGGSGTTPHLSGEMFKPWPASISSTCPIAAGRWR